MKVFTTCIFDLDGVIVDTAIYHHHAWNRLANELGFSIDDSFNERLKGVSRMGSLEIILDHGGIVMTDEQKLLLATRKNGWYLDYINNMSQDEIKPGVLDFFEHLKSNNIKIALGSSSKNARTVLNKIGMMDLFDAVVDGTDIINAKPDPEIFLKGATQTNSEPESCIVFEDAATGIEAALQAKMLAIGVGKSENLPKAHKVIQSFENLKLSELISEASTMNRP